MTLKIRPFTPPVATPYYVIMQRVGSSPTPELAQASRTPTPSLDAAYWRMDALRLRYVADSYDVRESWDGSWFVVERDGRFYASFCIALVAEGRREDSAADSK
jgi:hypothetical protein